MLMSEQLFPAMQVHERNMVALDRALLAIESLGDRRAMAFGLVEGGAVERIIRTVDVYADLLTNCCFAFDTLLHDGEPDMILALEAAGAPARIIRAMARHERYTDLQQVGCRTICNLAIGRDPRVRGLRVVLAGGGALERVTRAMYLHRNSTGVQERACLAVCNLAVNAANQVALAAGGALELVISAMDSHGGAFVLHAACHAIKSHAIKILARSEQNNTVLASCRAHERIVTAMRLHQNDESVQTAGCLALQTLAAKSAENLRMLVGAGAIERIL
jgi:hypothetical protein